MAENSPLAQHARSPSTVQSISRALENFEFWLDQARAPLGSSRTLDASRILVAEGGLRGLVACMARSPVGPDIVDELLVNTGDVVQARKPMEVERPGETWYEALQEFVQTYSQLRVLSMFASELRGCDPKGAVPLLRLRGTYLTILGFALQNDPTWASRVATPFSRYVEALLNQLLGGDGEKWGERE